MISIFNLIGGFGRSGVTTPASFYHDTITVSDGNANAFIYQPEDIDNPPAGAVTINSVEKDAYAAINTAIGYIEFASIPHTSLSANWTAYTYSGAPKLTMIELYKHP